MDRLWLQAVPAYVTLGSVLILQLDWWQSVLAYFICCFAWSCVAPNLGEIAWKDGGRASTPPRDQGSAEATSRGAAASR